MRTKSILLAGAILASPLAKAETRELPSTVCVPALQALQEPTTEDNLTPYDPFNRFNDTDIHLDEANIPNVEPTTTGMAVIILKEIGKVVGTKIYEAIFRDGAKRTLTKADFDRISEIVKEALRDDAKRKINSCVISIQNTAKELAANWDAHLAMDAHSTAGSIIDTIYNFDHLYSKVALVPSAMLIGSLRAGIAQEFLIRDASKTDAFFKMGVDRLLKGSEIYKAQVDSELLDHEKPSVRDGRQSFTRCGNEKVGHAYCIDFVRYFWGKMVVNINERCEESKEDCRSRWVNLHFRWDDIYFWVAHESLREAVYHENLKDEKAPEGVIAWEKLLKATPARQGYTPYVKIIPPRPRK